MTVFYLAGIIITFFLAGVLLSKKNKTAADYVLVTWLFIIGFHLFLFYWQITGEVYDYPYLLGIQVPMPLLHGPLLYIYTRTVTRNHFSRKYWLHFLPAAITFIILYKYFALSAAEKIYVYKHDGAGFEGYSIAILIALIISGFSYVVLSFYELRQYSKRISEEFSDTEKINLNWLRYLICGILGIWLTIFIDGDDWLIYGAVVLFVILLGYFGIQQEGIFTQRRDQEREPGGKQEFSFQAISETGPIIKEDIPSNVPAVSVASPVRYKKSALQKDTASKIHRDLSMLMQSQKVFKQEELTLPQLAEMLNVHPNNLSQVINTYENKTFYDYINTLRIEEFKELVQLPQNSRYTLLSLAFEVGFNSKTSFNRNFKKITGQSPSAYLKEANVELSD
ncbi:MAG: helix-turn-helix domain-containing protein [Flavisolibacter sp.]|jgi:AraC-like DNA-binding protein